MEAGGSVPALQQEEGALWRLLVSIVMTVSDSLHYLIIGNPVSKAVAGAAYSMLGFTFKKLKVGCILANCLLFH